MTFPGGLLAGSQSAMARLLAQMQGQPQPTPAWNPNANPVQGGMQSLLSQNLSQNPVQGEGPGLMAQPPQEDPAHNHRKGIRGGILHAIGADRTPPELKALLTDEQAKRAQPGLISSIGNFLIRGRTPQQVQMERAATMIGLQDKKVTRDTTARQQQDWRLLQMKHGPQPSDQQAAQTWLTNMARDANAMGLPQAKELTDAAKALGYEAKVLGQGAKLVGPAGNVLAENEAPERNPIMGSPEWKQAIAYQASLIGQNDRTLVAVDDGNGNPIYIPRAEAVGRKPWYQPGVAGARGSAAMRKAVAANNTSAQEIRDLIKTLSQPGAAKAGAVGWKAYIPDAILNRVFPQGVATRSGVQNVGSLLLHDRFGAALTKTELQRAGFIPFDTDDSRTAIDKLQRLLTYTESETGFLQDQVSSMGSGETEPTGGKKVPSYEEWLAEKKKGAP